MLAREEEKKELIRMLETHPDGTQFVHEGSLYLYDNVNITKLPNDLVVEGNIYLYDNPNIIELNQSMRGLAAAFAKCSPDTVSDGITSISSNNSSVNNTNNSFSDSVERDVIYMDRNKTRKQNAYRGDFF
jgi:hypothetical protein